MVPEAFGADPEIWGSDYQPEAEPEPRKESDEGWTAIAQAVFAGFLVILSGIQGFLAYRQYRTYEAQRRLMRRQANISSRQTDLAEKQFLLSGRQTDLAEKQHGLQRVHLITDKRPRLRVRNVVIRIGDAFRGNRLTGQCYVSNIGGTDAKIEESHVLVYANQMGLPMERPYEGMEANNPLSGTIIPGASIPLLIEALSPFTTAEEAGRAFAGAHPFYVMGWISYSDHLGNIRRTAFCRKWDGNKRRFVREDNDPDYEHEE